MNGGAQRQAVEEAFTLVELLVVIAIIAILAAMLMPAMNAALKRADTTQAKTEVRALEAALKAYLSEYHVNPTNLVTYDRIDAETSATGIQVEEGVVRMLRGENYRNQNPHGIAFADFASVTVVNNYFVDPWGNPYKYMLDYNLNGVTHVWFTDNDGETNLQSAVAVWSRGPNGSDKTGFREDDPRSW